MPENQKIEYSMYDLSGRNIVNRKDVLVKNGELKINTAQLKTGVYFINIKTIKGIEKFKAIKIL